MFDFKTRILIVDDMFAMRKTVIKLCQKIGFTDFTEAADGVLALQAIQEAQPSFGLIISDWNMPNMTGLELLKKLRGDNRYKTLPFLMLTAEAEQEQITEALQAGVSNYTIKPVVVEVLTEKLESIHSRIYKK